MTDKIGWYDRKNREYVVELEDNVQTPLPWSNLISNKNFGTLVTASGASFTWFLNSALFRLTPWVNDPVTENCGEKIFLSDEATKEVWSPTPLPIREKSLYRIRHGLGYTTFEHESHQIGQKVRVFVHPEKPLKFIQITLHNLSKISRRISLSYTCQWVLGSAPGQTRRTLWTENIPKKNILLAKVLSDDFRADYTAFLSGNNQSPFFLSPSEQVTHTFILGVARDKQLSHAIQQANNINPDKIFSENQNFWKKLTGGVQVESPDPETDILINDRLIHQTLSSRLWGRTGFSQPGGAFGFRDQLQDCLALIWSWPALTREQILLAAGRQLPSGEVQAWWHPPENDGVISSGSDTHLWLVYATLKYWQITRDDKILDEAVSYLHENQIEQEKKTGSLYEHCLVSLERTLSRTGPHGLPLILSGDWNDSLNNVGPKHQGESLWLSMFLAYLLENFSQICLLHQDFDRAQRYQKLAREQAELIEKHGWDGQWFARAFTDSGEKIGISESPILRIDSIVQSWSAICNLVNKDLVQTAMKSFERELVDKENRLVRLLAPPLTGTTPYLGYIQEYPPGVRENGSFYCHAAIWAAWALATLGEGDKAMEIINMVNPLKRTSTKEDMEKYMVEPYVLASDIYTEPPFVGRGGWTWYTGSAATLYFVFVEEILGLKVRGEKLTFNPCLPRNWPKIRLTFHHQQATYEITILNPHKKSQGVKEIELDGEKIAEKEINLSKEEKTHLVTVLID